MKDCFNRVLQEKLRGENLSKLSRDLGIPKTLLHEWINAKRMPSLKNIEHIKALADYLNLTLDELLAGESRQKLISLVSFEDSGRKYRINIERMK